MGRRALTSSFDGVEHRRQLRLGTKRWDLGEGLLHHDLQVGLAAHHLSAEDPPQLQIGGSRRRRRGLPNGLAEKAGKVVDRGDCHAVFGHGGEGSCVLHLLVGVSVLTDLRKPPRQRDDGRTAQIGVLESGRQIQSAHRLGATNPDPPADPGVAVGHVGRRLLTVGHDSGDPHPLHFRHGLGYDHGHEEEVCDAVPVQGLGQKAGSRHRRHRKGSPRMRPADLSLGTRFDRTG